MLRSKASSAWPKRVARVRGVSPRAFLMWVEAPLRTRYLAISRLGLWPQHRWRAVSPLEFLVSKMFASYRPLAPLPLRYLIRSRLLILTPKCKSELSCYSVSLKLISSAPCCSIFRKLSKSPRSAAALAVTQEPLLSSRCSIISALATGSWQKGHFWMFLRQ